MYVDNSLIYLWIVSAFDWVALVVLSTDSHKTCQHVTNKNPLYVACGFVLGSWLSAHVARLTFLLRGNVKALMFGIKRNWFH